MDINRRQFIKQLAQGNAGFGAQAIPDGRDVLVCIFQRGAADGLNSVVPYGDSNYLAHRPVIGVPDPGELNGAIDLDGFFGFHPALAPLKPIYDASDLALVHATGVPHGSRSHFTAQGLIERGVTDKGGPTTGWLGRHLTVNPINTDSAFGIVSISGNVPVALVGGKEPLAISNLGDFGFDPGIISSGYTNILGDLYRQGIPFSSPALSALNAVDELQAAGLPDITPDNDAVYPSTDLGNKLRQVSQLIKSTLPSEVICVDSDGWDHHENLPTFINQSLAQLAEGLAVFYQDMGTRMSRVTVLVYTEFGRRVFENGSVGTDHGTGGVAYLMGGSVNGGQVFRDWPGLEVENLALNEDLAITTDIRSVLAELLSKRLGGTDVNLVFPGYTGTIDNNLFSAFE